MNNQNGSQDRTPFSEIGKGNAELIRKHANLRESKAFQDQTKYLGRMTRDFLKTAQMIWFAATRDEAFVENSLVLRSIDDLNQSVVAMQTLVDQGMLSPVHREMRYLLESSVKNLYVDQKTPSGDFHQKVMFLHEQVPPSSISVVDELNLPLDVESRRSLIADIKGMYSRACAYVHPSKTQIDERVRLASEEAYVGFERPQDLVQINKEIFRVYEAILVLMFSGLGTSFLGDLFILWLDEDQSWRFHKGKYMKSLSAIFDYKLERKQRSNRDQSIS